MFGIAVADIQSLAPEEQVRYQAVYCGICHSLARRRNQPSRMCVTYDMALLALLLESLNEAGEKTYQSACALHPLKEHAYVQGKFVDYAADLSVAMAYHKCLDDWSDDKKKSSLAASKVLEGAYKNIAQDWPLQCEVLESGLRQISEFESILLTADSEQDRNILLGYVDQAAGCFGTIMATMFAVQDDFWHDTLYAFGHEMGRFIYYMDAAVDRKEDAESGAFNPFNMFETPDEDVRDLLGGLINSAAKAFERLPLEQDLHLMRSVLYAGVWQQLNAQKDKQEQE